MVDRLLAFFGSSKMRIGNFVARFWVWGKLPAADPSWLTH